ncbi:hypothetical protein [Cohnella thermotolerans]|uniref:hypothetical protein n=1 Tax=Cohnella thermotolerans TaxID=329858 RepID=UPI000411DF69|nr:hypothetical protein [Cohnella thermotolerans]
MNPMSHTSIMFRFPSDSAARLAYDTLEELGYDPELHDGGRLHIHVVREDLVSALEIVQSCGGELIERAEAEDAALTNASYSLDCIPIPAHIVNEDWASEAEEEGGTLTPLERQEAELRELHPDPGAYDTFEAR